MMRTVDATRVEGAPERVFAAAAEVERWPSILSHYRWVRFLARHDGGGLVEMSAYRQFGPLGWPTWWVSRMTVHPDVLEVRYRHVRGVTAGMDVVWRLVPAGHCTAVEIVHQWKGPRWPLIGRFAANSVIGPLFIHHIASQTLAGIKHHVESS